MRTQLAGPYPGPKPSWDDAPPWAVGLYADPWDYYWAETHAMHVQYFVEFRP